MEYINNDIIMKASKSEVIAMKLIRGEKISREDVVYLQKYHQVVGVTGRKLSEDEVLATDYHKLPKGYRALQTSLVRRGYTCSGKGMNYNVV